MIMTSKIHKINLNCGYISRITFINIIQVIIIKALFKGDLSTSLGSKCLYYNSMGYKVLCYFPFIISVYYLIKTFEEEVEISKLYTLCRYQSFQKWCFSYFGKSICMNTVIFLLSYSISSIIEAFEHLHDINISFIMFNGFFYTLNSTLCFTTISLIYAIIHIYSNKSFICVLFLLVFSIILLVISFVYDSIGMLSFLLLIPITHFGVFKNNLYYFFSLTIGVIYMAIVYKLFLSSYSNSDILR